MHNPTERLYGRTVYILQHAIITSITMNLIPNNAHTHTHTSTPAQLILKWMLVTFVDYHFNFLPIAYAVLIDHILKARKIQGRRYFTEAGNSNLQHTCQLKGKIPQH